MNPRALLSPLYPGAVACAAAVAVTALGNALGAAPAGHATTAMTASSPYDIKSATLDDSDDFTLAAWVRVPENCPAGARIFDKWIASPDKEATTARPLGGYRLEI